MNLFHVLRVSNLFISITRNKIHKYLSISMSSSKIIRCCLFMWLTMLSIQRRNSNLRLLYAKIVIKYHQKMLNGIVLHKMHIFVWSVIRSIMPLSWPLNTIGSRSQKNPRNSDNVINMKISSSNYTVVPVPKPYA